MKNKKINQIEFENILEVSSSFFNQMNIIDFNLKNNNNVYKYLMEEDISLLKKFILKIKKIESDFVNANPEEKIEIFSTIKKYSRLDLEEIIQQLKEKINKKNEKKLSNNIK